MHIPSTEIMVLRHDALLCNRDLPPGDYIVGREEGADLVVEDEHLSARHMRLSIRPHEILVEDLGSESGTFVQQNRIELQTRLHPSQIIRLGPSVQIKTRRRQVSIQPEESLTPQAAVLYRLLPECHGRGTKYVVGARLAKGGMGAILEAKDVHLQRTVAMKVILSDRSEASLARFIAEARLTGQLQHPNIVPVYEFGIDEHDQPFYAMKYVRGVTLHHVLEELRKGDQTSRETYPQAKLLTIYQKVCDAVAFAHSQKVIHRDLKPENIMLGEFGEVLVMDWGLAKRWQANGHASPVDTPRTPGLDPNGTAATLAGSLVGTPAFMSPEQASGVDADFRSDLYALGAILHHLLYLQPPVSGPTVDVILERVRSGKIEFPGAQARARIPWRVPDSLAAVTAKAMHPEPAQRYQSVAQLQEEITAYQGGFATVAEQASLWKQIALAIRRHQRESALSAIFLLLLVMGGVIALLHLSQERNRAEAALEDLRESAPAFATQATSLALQNRFPEALAKLEYALKLRPASPEYLLAKGDLLRSQLDLKAASEAYRRAAQVSGGERGRSAAALCERLLTTAKEDGSLSRSSLFQLYHTMTAEKRPAAEQLKCAKLLGIEHEIALPYWRERLRELLIETTVPMERRLSVRPDGLLSLDLSQTSIADLTPLAGMPLANLNLAGCKEVQSLAPLRGLPLLHLNLENTLVTDLSPLHGIHLESLNLRGARVVDLSPLKGLPLKTLDCSHIPALDFSPLQGMPLHILRLDGTHVGSLDFLRGMEIHLRQLSLGACSQVRQLGVLSELPLLEILVLPQTFIQLPAEDIAAVRALQRHPALSQLTTKPMDDMQLASTTPQAEFWKEWGADLDWIQKLRAAGAVPILTRLPNGTWDVNVKDQPLRDLSCLARAPISSLSLQGTQVSDLKPLTGMRLRYLDLRYTAVYDLSPLRGTPLRNLYLWQTKVEDFSTLSTLGELEVLDLSGCAISDLSLIKSRHLRELRIGSTPVADLSPLAGLPLEKLHCDNTQIVDLKPLLQCRHLRWLIPPNELCEINGLRNHATLERLSYLWTHESEPTMTVKEFWEAYDRTHQDSSR